MEHNELKVRVLITVPSINRTGGVSSLYQVLKLDQEINCDYFNIQIKDRIRYCRFLGFIIMYLIFFLKCTRYDIIHLNPSFNRRSYYRDMLFIFIAKVMKCKVIVYWHGWQDTFEEKLKRSCVRKFLFIRSYGRVDISIVLGTVFKEKLLGLGYNRKVIIETNCFDNTFLINNKNIKNIKIGEPVRLLFLARIEKQKGIYVAIDSFNFLFKKGYNLELLIAGTGSEVKSVLKYLNDEKIKNVKYVGNVTGFEKHELLLSSDILLFPSLSEGLPLTILEGMAYGLAIVSSTVGGIPDVILNGENGYLVESLNPNDYADIVEFLLNDKEKQIEISHNNTLKANSKFLPEMLKSRLVSIYNNI
jgi:glycosyltransferase involved in cell wall biosynthesis